MFRPCLGWVCASERERMVWDGCWPDRGRNEADGGDGRFRVGDFDGLMFGIASMSLLTPRRVFSLLVDNRFAVLCVFFAAFFSKSDIS